MTTIDEGKPFVLSRSERDSFNRQTRFGNGDERCLLWRGPTDRTGYGRFTLDNGRTVAVHRLVWQAVMGREIPEGMQVDHMCHGAAVELGECKGGVCRHRSCCNPDHLELVTASENTRRQDHAGRRKTHCPAGHEYTEENTARRNGRRFCRQCDRDRRVK